VIQTLSMPILHKAVENGIADNLLRWRKHVEQRCSSFMQATTMQLLGMRQSREGFSKDKDKKKCLIVHIVSSDGAPGWRRCSPHWAVLSPGQRHRPLRLSWYFSNPNICRPQHTKKPKDILIIAVKRRVLVEEKEAWL
jgi:hypothetical protein